jgi:hypothetical protein
MQTKVVENLGITVRQKSSKIAASLYAEHIHFVLEATGKLCFFYRHSHVSPPPSYLKLSSGPIRVTRLANFSHIGRLFTIGQFSENDCGQHFLGFFIHG